MINQRVFAYEYTFTQLHAAPVCRPNVMTSHLDGEFSTLTLYFNCKKTSVVSTYHISPFFSNLNVEQNKPPVCTVMIRSVKILGM